MACWISNRPRERPRIPSGEVLPEVHDYSHQRPALPMVVIKVGLRQYTALSGRPQAFDVRWLSGDLGSGERVVGGRDIVGTGLSVSTSEEYGHVTSDQCLPAGGSVAGVGPVMASERRP